MFCVGGETGAGNLNVGPEVCDVAASGATCANRMPGSNENTSTVGNHWEVTPSRRLSKSRLKSNRSPNANLIIIEAKEIDIADVLAMEVIDTGTQEPGD